MVVQAFAPFAALLALLRSPMEPEDLEREDEPTDGLVCYWGCMGACIVTGHRQDQCDAYCTRACFTLADIPPGPTCDPEPVCE